MVQKLAKTNAAKGKDEASNCMRSRTPSTLWEGGKREGTEFHFQFVPYFCLY